MLLLVNEHKSPLFLFPNLSSYDINNQLAKFEKNLSVGSISVEEVHVKAVLSLLTSLNTTFLLISRSRFKQR